ncbi:hypothetical protein GBA52_004459 [Prunus armeniaca]|nr:hypothetical protein GBA52_004459 [Prunus armeniaca]
MAKLPVRQRLSRFIPNITLQFALSRNQPESINHLFMHCNFAQPVWNCIHGFIAPIPTVGDHIAWLSPLNTTDNQHGPNDFCKGLFIRRQIWDARKNLIFKDMAPHHARVLYFQSHSPRLLEGESQAQETQTGCSPYQMEASSLWLDQAQLRWINQKWSCYHKLFFIQNDNAHTLLAGAKNIGVNSITMAECLALRDGLAHAVHHGWRNIIIECDSKVVIDAATKKCALPLEYYATCPRCLTLGLRL